jgi:hypothetical protein
MLIGGLTNPEGRVVLRGVPPGQQTLRVLRVGYAEGKRPITVVEGQDQTVEVQLTKVRRRAHAGSSSPRRANCFAREVG